MNNCSLTHGWKEVMALPSKNRSYRIAPMRMRVVQIENTFLIKGILEDEDFIPKAIIKENGQINTLED